MEQWEKLYTTRPGILVIARTDADGNLVPESAFIVTSEAAADRELQQRNFRLALQNVHDLIQNVEGMQLDTLPPEALRAYRSSLLTVSDGISDRIVVAEQGVPDMGRLSA